MIKVRCYPRIRLLGNQVRRTLPNSLGPVIHWTINWLGSCSKRMSKLAFFTPWPPQPSGVATCSADVVPALAAAGHGIDVFVDEALVGASRLPGGTASPPAPGEVRVLGAHDFVWRHARAPYDLPVYQVGNS